MRCALVILALAACTPPAPAVTLTPAPTSSAAPESSRSLFAARIDVNFEDHIHLIGVLFDPTLARVGESVEVRLELRCDEPVPEGWHLFTHFTDETTHKSETLDDHELDPSSWLTGETHVHRIAYVIPASLTHDITVYVGFWRGASRLRIMSGPNDGENRAIAGTIKIQP